MTPQQLIVYWTEYVLRHNGTELLKALGTDMPLYKYLMLDIIASATIIISVVFFMTYTMTKKICAVVGEKSQYPLRAKKHE